MILEVFPVGPLQCNCSILGDEKSHEAIVVDPGDEIEEVLVRVQRHGLTVKQIVITHAHIDHIGGAMKLKQATGAPILMNEHDQAQIRLLPMQAAWVGMRPPEGVKIDQHISTGSVIQAGAIRGEVLHTPGHTEGSTCLYLPNKHLLVAGDTLFAGSIGRTDLPGGDFNKILRSLHNTLLALPDETSVIPGHGPATTIAAERESNPFLQK
jgi:hydroxyacylglutathione hydrolase